MDSLHVTKVRCTSNTLYEKKYGRKGKSKHYTDCTVSVLPDDLEKMALAQ